jgi:lipopolysaccharide/colanic/teichoic acid biosynthesis glycosyltransferase
MLKWIHLLSRACRSWPHSPARSDPPGGLHEIFKSGKVTCTVQVKWCFDLKAALSVLQLAAIVFLLLIFCVRHSSTLVVLYKWNQLSLINLYMFYENDLV